MDATFHNQADPIHRGRHFQFGKNWSDFLKHIDDRAIDRGKSSLLELVELKDLRGRSFLDVGSGSGLFSLAGRLLGARVHSFDVDPQAVRCTGQLKARYLPDDDGWTIEQRSVVEDDLAEKLGQFDIVYCWGVLHHTGHMWKSFDNVAALAGENGLLIVAIYNDQGRISARWKRIKLLYNRLPRVLRPLVLWPALARLWGPTTLRDLLAGRPFHTWRNYRHENRGMHPWTDLVDWVGGYPFEVAKPEEVLDFCRARGLQLRRLKTCGGGRGCNEYVLQRGPPI